MFFYLWGGQKPGWIGEPNDPEFIQTKIIWVSLDIQVKSGLQV